MHELSQNYLLSLPLSPLSEKPKNGSSFLLWQLIYTDAAIKSMRRLEAEKRCFENENDTLKARLSELEEENASLKQEIAKLSKTSKNSSKPPSSDIVKGRGKTKGQNKDDGDGDGDGGLGVGGQPGHSKHTRAAFSEEEISNVYDYTLEDCPDCQGELQPGEEAPKVIQQIEIKEIPIEIDEHRGHAYWCPNCQKIYYAPIPDDIVKEGLCAPDLTALVGYMKGVLHASFSTIRKFLRDVMKIKISKGQLAKLVTKVGNALDAPYDELLKQIPLEENVNVDETGHKENGVKFWTWCFRADMYVLFKIDQSRGSKVLIEVLGKNFNGLLGCDYFSAYRKYIKEFNIVVQFCIAHLIRDIRFLISLPDKETREYGEKLLDLIREMFEVINNSENNGIGEDETKKQLIKIREKILEVGINEASSKLDENLKETKKHAQAIAERFRKFGDAYFQFITTPNISPTNNIAEQAIRFVVIDRHVTQGTRSLKGRKNCERLWTVIGTCEIQGRSAYQFIRKAVRAYFQGLPPPSLFHYQVE
jgi:transposase